MKSLFLILSAFILSSAAIYSQWTNLNPVPDSNDLSSVFFIDDNTGWMVGSEGFIKKTTNAGLDWIQQSSGTTLTLSSVQFINQNTGWICGEEGLIIKTTNGGLNWFELTSGTSEILTDLHFFDLNIGWVVGFGETILKTTNGGSSWISQSSDTSFTLNSVDFVDDLYGYAVGYTPEPILKILKTTDGGLNWIDISSNLYEYSYSLLNTVKFIDANNGFVGGSIGGGPNIWKTTDGGETWETLPLNLQKTNNKMQLDYSVNPIGITSIYFKDSNIGYAVGNWMGWWHTAIWTTTDGGSTWIIKSNLNQGVELQSVYGNSTGKGWAVGYRGLIFVTEDEGSSWVQSLNACDIHSVFFINENIGWAVGIGHAGQAGDIILKTTNGGKIWKTQLFWGGSYGTIKSVYFLNENIGWTTGDEGVLITTNGGENWTGTVGGRGTASIFFIDQNTGWGVKETYNIYEDAIFKTTDGGITWRPKSTQSSSSVFFANANIGWAVGNGGSILKSTNGGETWVTKTSGTTDDLNCVKFYNSNLGICVGNAGTVLLSTDGGETWISKNSGTTNDLKAVTFTNSTSFWIAGTNGEILSTSDLGINWTSYDGVTANDLTSLCFINDNTGWFGGMNATMFNYSTEQIPLPIWSNQIIIQDAGSTESSGVLIFGQHPDATESIDASLGEYELPPPPIVGVFDSRFILPTVPEVSSFKDLRDSSQTEITWTITFQPGSAGYPMIFSWDSLSFPAGTIYLTDRINGTYVNVNMKNQSSCVLTNSAITSLKIKYNKEFCSIVSVSNGWNMISVPYLAEDMALSNLYPTATSFAYKYEDGFAMEDTLIAGVGYWLKFVGNEELQICGTTPGDTVRVKTGWNLFGVYEKDIPVIQLTTTPQGIIATYFFGFENGYHITDTLKSGSAYWVRATSNGVINLNSGSLVKDREKGPIAQIEQDWGKIKITDNEGNSIILYAAEEEIESEFYELPPTPPSGIFDVRYGSGKLVEVLSSEKIILISSDKYPITIRVEGLSLSVRYTINEEMKNEELRNGEEIRITNSKITSIEVTGTIKGELPITYELNQNYPNPFNPNTTIKFAVPKESNVNLSIYNVLGELISTLVNEEMKPGYYEYQFNASNLASGVYLYRIAVGSFVDTKKMILLR